MVCNACGHWNEDEEERCARCGRRVKQEAETSWQRSGLELDDSQLRAGKEQAAGASSRAWKHEISRKLEEYRERRRAGPSLMAEPPADLPQTSASKVIPFERAADSQPQGSQPFPAAARRGLPARQRAPRETDPPDSAGPYLPPLGAGAPAAKAEARAVAEPRPQRKTTTEVRCAATVAAVQIRLLAGILDLALIVVALGVFLGVFHGLGGSIRPGEEGVRTLGVTSFVILSFYWTFYVGHFGATPGMTWSGLRLLDFYGRIPSGKQRAARALGLILSSATLGAGFVWSLLDDEKLTWHDRMSKTFLTRDGSVGFRSKSKRVPIRSARLPDLARKEKKA